MIIILLGWLGMVQHWEQYKQVMYFRLKEIEQDLGLWKNRYFGYLNNQKKVIVPNLLFLSESDKDQAPKT